MHEADDGQLVCYCVNGHMHIPRGRYAPSNCPVCNAPMDMNRMFIPPIQDKVQQPVQVSEPIQSPQRDEPPIQPPRRMNPPVPLVPHAAETPGVSAASQRVVQAPPTIPTVVRPTARQDGKPLIVFQLDYFGEKITIPEEGGWLGRSKIGEDLFEGNLLISREHVRIQPTAEGGLRIGPDNSLNGTFVDTGKGKSRLGNESLAIEEGTVIWLYNLPLKVERKRQ